MSAITASEIIQKIKALPLDLLHEIDKYIEFLTFKSSHSDWSEHLSNQHISLIEKGTKDIEKNRVIQHKLAKEQIKNHIKRKSV